MASILKRRRSVIVGAVLTALLIAGVVGYTARGATRSAAPPAGPSPQTFGTRMPATIRSGLASWARAASLDAQALEEIGASELREPYRAAIVGIDRAGRVRIAIASTHSHTSFVPVPDLFRQQPLALSVGVYGDGSSVQEVGLTVVARDPVARVEVETDTGALHELVLARWPHVPYASASTVATSRAAFPTEVRAYDAHGRLLVVEAVDTTVPSGG
jgi:hypothetical protein